MQKERWYEDRLSTSERPRFLYTYYVTGHGDFPFDMLRYDSCWPASGEDAARLFYTSKRFVTRSVKIRSYRLPTIDRWQSFNWSVGVYNLGENK
jgi:hypothetical protein